MKKFVRNILIFLLFVSLIVLSMNHIYVQLYRGDFDHTNKFSSIPDKLQFCNFGSSHGLFAYNYEYLDEEYNCFNYGMTNQSLSYDYRLFQHYGEHIDQGTVVFITVSYFSLFGKAEVVSDDFASKNKRYYLILPPSLIKEYDITTDLFVHYFPVLGAGTGELIKTLFGKSKSIDDALWREKVSTDIDIIESAEDASNRHILKNKYDDYGNRIVNQEEVDALYNLVKGCQEKGAIPVLITTPYLKEYTDKVKSTTDDFYGQFYGIVDQVVADTGVEYYDYAFDERFTNSYSWFMDVDHLNAEGARNFVDVLMQEVVYAKGYY